MLNIFFEKHHPISGILVPEEGHLIQPNVEPITSVYCI